MDQYPLKKFEKKKKWTYLSYFEISYNQKQKYYFWGLRLTNTCTSGSNVKLLLIPTKPTSYIANPCSLPRFPIEKPLKFFIFQSTEVILFLRVDISLNFVHENVTKIRLARTNLYLSGKKCFFKTGFSNCRSFMTSRGNAQEPMRELINIHKQD